MRDELLVRPAAPGIRRHVARYWGYAHHPGAPATQREPIATSVVLIFGLDSELTLADGVRVRSFVAGLDDSCAVIGHDGTMRGVQVDLAPPAARMLFGVPMHELSGGVVVTLEELLGRDGLLLEEELTVAPSWEARFAILDRDFARRLAEKDAPPADVMWAWRRLRETQGRVRVEELAGELRCSRKHLAARFREYVGVPPKLVARIQRFRCALDLLGRSEGSIAEVACACGYYDEPHLDRDFRAFAGTTPAAWRDDPRAVTFVQDGAVAAA